MLKLLAEITEKYWVIIQLKLTNSPFYLTNLDKFNNLIISWMVRGLYSANVPVYVLAARILHAYWGNE